MAVSEQTPYKEYTANGSANSFALEFDCENQDHLIVLVDDVEPVVGTWSLSDGAVVFGTAPINGKKITIQRNTPVLRSTNFQSFNNSFRPDAINKDLDRVWLRLQEEDVAKFLLNQLINMNYEDLDEKGQNIRTELINKLTEQANQLSSQIIQQGVTQQQLQNYYSFLLSQMANLSSNKNWLASLIADASGKNQQEINNTQKKKQRSVLDYGAVPSLDVASDIAFSNAVADLQDGDTLTVDGEFYLASNWNVNKQINIEVNGDIYMNGDAGNAVILRSDIVREITGSDLIALPKKGDAQLQLSTALKSELGNLSDYYIVIRSTEKLVGRLGRTESEAYLKSETNFFTHNDGSLANSIYLDYKDLSKFYARVYRKQRQCTVKNLIPKIKAGTLTSSDRSSLVVVQGRSNIRFENSGFNKKNGVSTGAGWTQIDCVNLDYDTPNAGYWNKNNGDSYAFLSMYCAYVTFSNPKCVHSQESKRDRFYASRHSSKITFNNLTGSFDEHYGYDYVLNNYTSPKDNQITFAGGDLTINNPDNPCGIMIQSRTDTPYCEGTLRITGGKSDGYLIYNYLDSAVLGQDFTRKFFDKIIIDGTELLNNGNQACILMYDYGSFPGITQQKTAITVTGSKYKRKANAPANGCLIIGNSTAKAFSEIVIDNLDPVVDGADTESSRYPLLKTVRADSLTVSNTPKFTFQNSVFDSLTVIGGSMGDHNLGFYDLNVSDYAKFIGTTFNASSNQYSCVSGLSDKIFYVGCLFKTAYPFTNSALAAAIAGAYANTFDTSVPNTLYTLPIDVTNYTNPTRIRNLRGTYTLATNTTVPANGISAVYPPNSNISLNGARIGDIIGAGLTGGTGIEVVAYCAENNTVSFYLKNNTSAPIDVPAGAIVKLKLL